MARWQFRDLNAPATYVFSMSPDSATSPGFERRLTRTPTTAPTGKVVIFEGRRTAPTIDFSGMVLDQADKSALDTWFDKHRAIEITDDLGRVTNVYLTALTWERRPTAKHPWRQRFSATAVVADLTGT